jgi:hypothetical protein
MSSLREVFLMEEDLGYLAVFLKEVWVLLNLVKHAKELFTLAQFIISYILTQNKKKAKEKNIE